MRSMSPRWKQAYSPLFAAMVVGLCAGCSSHQDDDVTVEITAPMGSKDSVPAGTGGANSPSWLDEAPYCFDFQWVKEGSPGYCDNCVQGTVGGGLTHFPSKLRN